MTDLHTHILPHMDDGATDFETAVKLLNMEYEQGVRKIALTSHFNCETTTVGEYLEKRFQAYTEVLSFFDNTSKKISLKLGSEVFFSPWLMKMDISPLCIEGTGILLLELPTSHQPSFLQEFLLHLDAEGITPLIAHVERYPYVMKNPELLEGWIENGAYTQMNSSALTGDIINRRKAVKLIKKGLIHVLASDVHSIDKRPPTMKAAFDVINKKLGEKTIGLLKQNADRLFEGGYNG